MSGKLFGTDGVRGRANEYPMTAEMALKFPCGCVPISSYFRMFARFPAVEPISDQSCGIFALRT